MTDIPQQFDWPPESNRDTVAREIDRQRLPESQRMVLRALFDHFWPASETPDYRPGQRMLALSIPQLAALTGLHGNTVRKARLSLIESGYLGTCIRPGKPDLIGLDWGRLFGCKTSAETQVPLTQAVDQSLRDWERPESTPTVADCTPTVPLQSGTVPLQSNVGVTVPLQSDPQQLPTLQEILDLLKSQNAFLCDEIQHLRNDIAALKSLLNPNQKTPTVPLQSTDCRGTVALQSATSHDHEFMNEINNSFMSHDHEATPTVPLQSNVGLHSTVGVQTPIPPLSFPDPYFEISVEQLRSNAHVDALLENLTARKYWPLGDHGRLEFFALVEYSLGAGKPGASLRTILESGYRDPDLQRRIRQGLSKARVRLSPPRPAVAPAPTPANTEQSDLTRAQSIARARVKGPLPHPVGLGRLAQAVAANVLETAQ